MIEVYGGEYDLDIQFRRAGTVGIEQRVILPDGEVLTSNMVSASHAASVIIKMTGDLAYDAEYVRDLLNSSVSYYIPTKSIPVVMR